MKILKLQHIAIATCLFLTSCGTMVNYLGDAYPATNKVDVYYDAKDIKQEYKVIGHLSMINDLDQEVVKKALVNKSKAMGADGVIILQTTGKDNSTVKADAIKYSEKAN
ncbi:hypothetical protein SAMN05216464_109201 [Mucilaginibacter pineti]|uniref:YdgH/BhsA/McbA-like domain-containing protein n=1 Tax=Mucilaginibacter pineti TaxID=1391627 RepID=A0A1G7FSX9_9SPHI|nr:hypothetical protein [Mucilaginibacter pineti]SDE79004.1 hypothetical protein SAMN05216464_109201 [Mucilaginibacter pineti]